MYIYAGVVYILFSVGWTSKATPRLFSSSFLIFYIVSFFFSQRQFFLLLLSSFLFCFERGRPLWAQKVPCNNEIAASTI